MAALCLGFAAIELRSRSELRGNQASGRGRMKKRAGALQQIEEKSFDVCVIGGGATGSACALDAQLRGLKTVQLEARDFASGTSSASTKMAHGGVRYLEEAIRRLDPREFRVVTEALRERRHMLENAPFLAKIQMFLTPCYTWFDAAYFEIGLKLYDWISGGASLARSYFASREETLRLIPTLNPERLVGGVVYADGQFDDARYYITLVKTFAESGGEPLNYARVVALEKDKSGKLAAATVEDEIAHKRFTVRARAFVNATGPFADTIREMATPGVALRMRPSKGVHILFPLEVLSSAEALLIPKTEDGRVLFAIPWLGRLLVGTTEQEVTIGDELYVTREEAEYLLRHLNRYLTKPVTREQIVSGFAGARPLLSDGKSTDTKQLARDHEVEIDARSGLASILGGKWTTHRAMAEDTLNSVQKYLGGGVTACKTIRQPLTGARDYTPEFWRALVKSKPGGELTAKHLAHKYGTHAEEVLALAKEDARLAAPIIAGLAPIRAEVVFAAREEMAISIEDVLARRIGLQFYGWKESIEAAPVVGEFLARELGWDEVTKARAIDEYAGRMRGLMTNVGLAM